MADEHKPRPVYTNIHVSQIVAYRLPIAGVVSILHRVSGALMFVLLPLVVWLLDVSLTSEVSYERFSNAFVAGIGSMTYSRFILYNVVGGLAWVVGFVVLGYFFGNMPQVKRNFGYVIMAIIVLSVMPMVIEFLRARKKV